MSRTRALVLLALYLVVVFYLTLVDHPVLRPHPADRLKLVPFQSIVHFWNKGGRPFAINILGNVGIFAPFGFLVPWLRPKAATTTLAQVGLTGTAISLLIESLQFAQGRRVADIDDVILNAAGALLGYLVYRGSELVREGIVSRSRSPHHSLRETPIAGNTISATPAQGSASTGTGPPALTA